MSGNSSSATARISNYLTMIVLIVMALSIVALILAVNALAVGNEMVAGYLTIIGLISMTLSVYVLMQSKRRAQRMKIQAPKVMTTIECKKCNFKNIREFERGDYILKELEPCQKCPEEKMLITAIYKEVTEKEKPTPF